MGAADADEGIGANARKAGRQVRISRGWVHEHDRRADSEDRHDGDIEIDRHRAEEQNSRAWQNAPGREQRGRGRRCGVELGKTDGTGALDDCRSLWRLERTGAQQPRDIHCTPPRPGDPVVGLASSA